MISRPSYFTIDKVTQKLYTQIIGKKVFHFKEINSTNLYVKKLVKDGIEEGTVVIADIQTRGRGRKNRIWSSLEGGLWFSILLYPNISPQYGMLITMASSIAVAQGIKDITDLTPEIKWPNDILISKQKVCGILTELESKEKKINYAVVGIGINVNNLLNDDLQNIATTLKQEVGNHISRIELLKSILKRYDENYHRLISGDYNFIRDLWLQYSNIIGKKIQVKDEKIVETGIVSDIDDNGYLILDTNHGKVRIISGDVKYL